MNPTVLNLVVPVYNEENAVSIFIQEIEKVFSNHNDLSIEVIFIDDGSRDNTINAILSLNSKFIKIRVIELSRNFGKESALTAGLQYALGDLVVPMDVDLQDPPEIILKMIEKLREGYDVVEGRRMSRAEDSFLKRISAKYYYAIHNRIAKPKITADVGDFRLMTKTVVQTLNTLPESQRFMKGLFAWVGYKTACVDYDRPRRTHGVTKFKPWSLWHLALEGITSFSTLPLKIWTYFGLVISSLALSYAAFILFKTLILGIDLPGYPSLVIIVMFLGGIQLIGIGILGEYLGRVYLESKRRPSFVVRKVYSKDT